MKYYKYTSPYYATIAAKNMGLADHKYMTEVSEDYKEFREERAVKELTRDEFIAEVATTVSEDTLKPIGKNEAIEQLEEFENSNDNAALFGIDSCLV